MRDNDAHLGIALEGNVNAHSNEEIKAVLNQAWWKKETVLAESGLCMRTALRRLIPRKPAIE